MRHWPETIYEALENAGNNISNAIRALFWIPGLKYIVGAYKVIARWAHHKLPRGLFARALLIIIVPMLLLQAVIATVFMERHWEMVTRRLADAVTGDIAAIIDLLDTTSDEYQQEIIKVAARDMGLRVAIEPNGKLPPPLPKPFFGLLDKVLAEQISEKIGRPFWIDTLGDSRLVEIRLKLNQGILRIFARRSMTYASNTHIFIIWMLGTSLVLIGIAALFLRGQIRPILLLTQAADNFGKGQRSREPFSPRGAIEIRRAGLAFILMRERIERQIEQRTTMLSGVSHDLRTILTRFKLQLALIGEGPEHEALNQDIEEMQKMLVGYIDFARGDAEEKTSTASLSALFQRQKEDFALSGKSLHFKVSGEDLVIVRPNAFARLIGNLATNAKRHATRLEINATNDEKWLTVTFDDDGPGIAADSREDVFKPFYRLDNARNLDSSGTGLGLAIARDITHSHGGKIALSDSSLGGLRVTIRIPS